MAEQTPTTLPGSKSSILGLEVDELAGLSVDELAGNTTAITMVMHYYKQLTDENASLRNDLNTIKTYVDGFREKKLFASVGAWLQLLGAVLLGFGVNLLTDGQSTAGWMTFIPGIIAQAVGLGFSLKDPK